MAPRATLLQVLPAAPPPDSGVGWVADGVAGSMRARGWRVERVTAEDLAPGMKGRTYAVVPAGLAYRTLRQVETLARDGVVAVEGHGFWGALAALALRVRRPPGVVTVFRSHGFWRAAVALAAADDVGLRTSAFRTWKSEMTYGALERVGVRASDLVIVQSSEDGRFTERVDGTAPERIVRLEPGIAPAPAHGAHAGPLRLLWVGRPSLVKGSDLLPDIARRLAERKLPVALEIVGHDAGAFADIAGVEVRGAIARDEVGEAMGRADAFLWTSRYEGFGLAPFEAMAHGLPVISAPVGGLVDHLRDGDNGVAVSAVASEAFADAVARFAALPGDERARMGAAARATAGALTWARHAERLERFLSPYLGIAP